MHPGTAIRIEAGIDRMASALFACASAFAVSMVFAPHPLRPLAGAECLAVAAVAYWICVRALGRVTAEPPRLPVPVFDVRQIEPLESPQLLLTDAREPQAPVAEEPLFLDDVLAQLGPDSRVVRLFDPESMPTPGQLNERTERHLGSGGPASDDASRALHDALAELRRSLR